MIRILITGGSGFLGGNLLKIASRQFGVYGTYHRFLPPDNGPWKWVHLDIRNRNEVDATLAAINPKAIIHAGGIGGIARCEADKGAAYAVNVVGTGNVAQIARRRGIRLIHVSTDLVFDGLKGHYTEDDQPNPVCCYGETKRRSEDAVSNLLENYSIVRSSLLFGWNRWSNVSSGSFAEGILHELESGTHYQACGDEFRSPLSVGIFCECLMEFAAGEELTGLYHVCGSERISAFDFAAMLAEKAGLGRDLILFGRSRSMSTPGIVRPRDCSMSNKKAVSALRTRIPTIEDAINEMISSRHAR
ncbi:MAG: SDR family oxidoreductase [Thermodesulfobacteriota bacterium]